LRRSALILFLILLVSGAGAVQINSIDAPETVEAGEEFEITVSASDATEVGSIILRVNDNRKEDFCPPAPPILFREDDCTNTFKTSIESDSGVELVAEDNNGNEVTETRSIEVSEPREGYSIKDVGSTERSISPGETARFKADVNAPSSQMVQVDWFLRPRGDVVASTQERVFRTESRVSTEVNYDELDTPPGDYTLAARVVKNADQKAVKRGSSVTLKRDGTDFGDDISVSIDQDLSDDITEEGTEVKVSVDANSGGLLGQRITLKEENGGYSETSSECDAPDSRPTGRVFDCSKSFNYEPTKTGNVELVAEAYGSK